MVPEQWSKRKKLGFMVPFRNWIREDKYYNQVKEVFNRDYVSEFFDVAKINKLLDDHKSGKKNTARKIYTIYTFLLWYGIYFKDYAY
jgi:asparagine synthase (glutamine-hydrolysing)